MLEIQELHENEAASHKLMTIPVGPQYSGSRCMLKVEYEMLMADQLSNACRDSLTYAVFGGM